MKKITLERKFLMPESDYCILWRSLEEVCPYLTFRKDAKNPKMAFQCDFYDVDLKDTISSIGIKKKCMQVERGTILEFKK